MSLVKRIKIGKINTSNIEIQHILRAWVAITLAFAIAMNKGFSFGISFFYAIILSGITVGLGFMLHEIAHKIVAQKYGCFAEFRANNQMLIVAILLSFTGVIFAAPGAVMIAGNVTPKKNGVISASGPAANLILASCFLILSLLSGGLFPVLAYYGIMINSWLAMFNLLPFPVFDGVKIMQWDKKVYVTMLVVAGAMLFYAGIM